MKNEFLNKNTVKEFLVKLYNVVIEDMNIVHNLDEFIEKNAELTTDSIICDMDNYVHQKDTSIFGNFKNVRHDWNFHWCKLKPFCGEVFDDMVKSVDDNTISKEDLSKFQDWLWNWFIEAFGTNGLKYNFIENINNELEELENNKN